MSHSDQAILDSNKLADVDDLPLRGEMRRIFALALPNIGTSVTRMLMGFVDFIMVSWLGTDAQAAISPASLMVFAILCLGNGVAISTTTFASQALGRGERREAGAFGWQTVYFAVAFGALTWPAILVMPLFYRWVGHPAPVMQAEIDYSTIALWSAAPSVVVWGLDGFFNGVQRPGVSVVSAVAGLFCNGVLNYALIFGHWGFPAMGMAGAALATVIGWCVRAAILMGVFLSGEFARGFHTREAWRPAREKLAGMIRVGGPTSVQWLLDIAAWVVFMTIMMGHYGTPAMAATNIGVQFMHVSFMPAVGIGIALTSLVGHAIGQGKPELAVRRTRAAMIMICAYMGAIGLVFWLARWPLMRLLSSDPAVIELGCIVLIWAAVFQAFDGLGITYASALRGAGDTRWPAGAFLVYCWGVFIAGGWLVGRLGPGLGINGPWMMCTLYIVLLGLTLWWRFARGHWKRIRLFEPKAAPGADVVAAEAMGTPG